MQYQPKTGKRCTCKRGIQRDNCPRCEGTGWQIDFQAIRNRRQDNTSSLLPNALVSRIETDDR